MLETINSEVEIKPLEAVYLLLRGVIGNTSDFGSEIGESYSSGATMKKLVFLSISVLFSGCYRVPIEYQDVYHLEYSGHEYIQFENGIVHNPDCKHCKKYGK